MTCMPHVLETVKSISGRELSKDVKLDKTVTISTSILAGVLVGNNTDILFLNAILFLICIICSLHFSLVCIPIIMHRYWN